VVRLSREFIYSVKVSHVYKALMGNVGAIPAIKGCGMVVVNRGTRFSFGCLFIIASTPGPAPSKEFCDE
jgi:hypothetical protein